MILIGIRKVSGIVQIVVYFRSNPLAVNTHTFFVDFASSCFTSKMTYKPYYYYYYYNNTLFLNTSNAFMTINND